jgi:hypothetical protein
VWEMRYDRAVELGLEGRIQPTAYARRDLSWLAINRSGR